MTGDSYIYEVRHIDNPSFVEKFSSIKKVRKHTGLSEESVVKCFDEHKYIKGWIVDRLFIPRKIRDAEKKQRTYSRGVYVFLPNGKILEFWTLKECSEAIGLSKQSILKHINQGTADRQGRTYDYPLEEEE